MESDELSTRELQVQYRRWLDGGPLARAIRFGAATLLGINLGIIPIDWLVYRDMFVPFLYVRGGLAVILTLVLSWTAGRWSVGSTYVTAYAGALMLLAVIYGTGGPASPYYAGMVLLFCGVGVLVPISFSRGLALIAPPFLTYLSMPFWTEAATPWEAFGPNVFFLSAAGAVGLVSCAILDRMRFQDFRQRRQIERARDELAELDRAKSRFTANIHHELRTPLTLMLAPLEAMLGGSFGELSPMQRSYLRTMHVNGLRLLKLINNLLDLARIESGQLEVRRRPCAVGRVAGSVVTGSVPLAEQKGVEVATRGLEELPEIYADSDAVEKVVINLVGNALKFTDAGGRVEVSGEVDDSGGVHLVVEDSGVGLAEDQLEQIFDRFAQVDTSATRTHEGTGIGLSLARELVEAHGGRIWAESEGLGRGTRVHVVLPRGEEDEEREEELLASDDAARVGADRPGASDPAGGHRGRGEDRRTGKDVSEDLSGRTRRAQQGHLVEIEHSVARWQSQQGSPASGEGPEGPPVDVHAPEVLVVEDNPDMRRLLAFVVGQEYRVRTACNGREALEAMEDRQPDLVLTDIMMPEMSGTELCRALKGDPATEGIPVVLVTSKAEREMQIEGLEGGADDYVTKPFHARELLARVRSLVHLRELHRDLESRNLALHRMNAELEGALAELKEAEVQLLQSERLAAVGELAAGVAHEINNPVNFALNALRALRGQVEELAEIAVAVAALDPGDPEARAGQLAELEAARAGLDPAESAAELRELVDILTEGLVRTQRLVGDLRDFAGVGRGRDAPVDLRRGLESTLQLLRRAIADAGIRVETGYADHPLWVRGDSGALNQVLLNLLKNSAEAVEGRPDARIRIDARREKGWIVVTIQDNGPGVPEEVRARLFEPFFTTKAAGRGSGLGLSICRRIVADHQGTILVSSPPGQGASFTVRLPELDGPPKAQEETP